MEDKIFNEWNKDEVYEWAQGFIEATEAKKLLDQDMSGLALSHATIENLQACGLTVGTSLVVHTKVKEKLSGKVHCDLPDSLS